VPRLEIYGTISAIPQYMAYYLLKHRGNFTVFYSHSEINNLYLKLKL